MSIVNSSILNEIRSKNEIWSKWMRTINHTLFLATQVVHSVKIDLKIKKSYFWFCSALWRPALGSILVIFASFKPPTHLPVIELSISSLFRANSNQALILIDKYPNPCRTFPKTLVWIYFGNESHIEFWFIMLNLKRLRRSGFIQMYHYLNLL